MYVCGMTVYDFCHVGHARMMVAFDVVPRWLRARGYEVTYVRNITDIDDKIIQRALENGEPIEALTERMIAAMHEDCDALGIAAPDARAARHRLRAADAGHDRHAREARASPIEAGNGDVNYAVRNFPGYGKLSRQDRSTTCAPASASRSTDGKHDPLDFVLWKARQAGRAAPVGRRRGARAGPAGTSSARRCRCALLGEHFDIHGGGQDLQFPHHENEIAQSEGATGEHVRQLLDAQRLRARRQREDVEVARQLLHDPRRAASSSTRESGALLHAARALPQPAQLQRRAPRRRAQRAARLTPR